MKIGHLAKPLQNGQFDSKIKNAKNMRKIIVILHQSCFEEKTARKNSKCSKNETILKIGHIAKAIAYAKGIAFTKWSVWVKN